MSDAQNIRHFTRQKGALEDSPRVGQGLQTKPRRYTFASDYDVDCTSTYYRAKRYATASLASFWQWYKSMSPGERHYYELLHPNVPSKMYFDLDAVLFGDENERKLKFVRTHVVDDMREFFVHSIGAKEGDCDVAKILHMKRSSSSTRCSSSDIVAECVERVILLDASNERKFSLHITFPDFVLKDPFHCGALMRRLECWLVEKYGSTADKNPYYVRTNFGEKEDDEHEFVIDRGVYTTYRVMRLPWSSKAKQFRFLYPIDENGAIVSRDPDYNLLVDSLIQHTVRMSCDPKGPIMLADGPRTSVLFCVCESRTPQAIEDARKYPTTVEWIEPASAGRRIWHMSKATMSSLLMHTYTNVGMAAASRARSNAEQSISSRASSSAAVAARRSAIQRVTETTVESTANTLIEEFGVDRETRPSANVHAKRRDLIESIFSISMQLVTNLGAPTWWSEFSPPKFSENDATRQIDPVRGTVRIYPSNVRHCESIGGEHRSNHVYFVLDTTGYGGDGFMRQICHNGCRMTRSCYRRPRDDDLDRMKVLRAKVQKLLALQYQGKLDVPSSISNKQTVFARHCVRVLVTSVKHFVRFAELMLDEQRGITSTDAHEMATQYLDGIANSFHVKNQQIELSDDDEESTATTETAVSDDDDEESCRYILHGADHHSVDHFDRLWQSACDTYEDAAQQVGVTETLCSTVILYAIAKLPAERSRGVAKLYSMYRAWLVRTLWCIPFCDTSIWRSDSLPMRRDIEAWYTIFAATTGQSAESVELLSEAVATTRQREKLIVYKHAARVERKYATTYALYRERVESDSYESDFVAQSRTHLFIHKASALLKQFVNFDC